MSLRKLQEHWQQGTLDESTVSIMPHIINPEDRAMIYVDAYRARLIEALEKTFLLLAKKMGEDDFCDLALDYINAHPSEYYSLSRFGKDLSIFLKQTDKKKLADIAELDWAISCAVEAESVIPITRDFLRSIPEDRWGDAVFECHPSLSVLDKYRVYRKATQVYYVEISSQEKRVLELILKKSTFAEICDKLGETLAEDEVVNYLIQQLSRWLDDELITNITLKETA